MLLPRIVPQKAHGLVNFNRHACHLHFNRSDSSLSWNGSGCSTMLTLAISVIMMQLNMNTPIVDGKTMKCIKNVNMGLKCYVKFIARLSCSCLTWHVSTVKPRRNKVGKIRNLLRCIEIGPFKQISTVAEGFFSRGRGRKIFGIRQSEKANLNEKEINFVEFESR